MMIEIENRRPSQRPCRCRVIDRLQVLGQALAAVHRLGPIDLRQRGNADTSVLPAPAGPEAIDRIDRLEQGVVLGLQGVVSGSDGGREQTGGAGLHPAHATHQKRQALKVGALLDEALDEAVGLRILSADLAHEHGDLNLGLVRIGLDMLEGNLGHLEQVGRARGSVRRLASSRWRDS